MHLIFALSVIYLKKKVLPCLNETEVENMTMQTIFVYFKIYTVLKCTHCVHSRQIAHFLVAKATLETGYYCL